MAEIAEFAKGDAGNGQLKGERELLGKALEDVQAIVAAMVGYLTDAGEESRNVYKVGLNTTRLLLALGDLIIGWLLLRQADVALTKLANGDQDHAFYTGKVAAARFFAATRLPLLTAERAVAEATDLDLMDLDESAF